MRAAAGMRLSKGREAFENGGQIPTIWPQLHRQVERDREQQDAKCRQHHPPDQRLNEALAPYRVQWSRPTDDPQPLPYLESKDNRAAGAFDIRLEVLIQTAKMRGAVPGPNANPRMPGKSRDAHNANNATATITRPP